jgi:hypothetical protein
VTTFRDEDLKGRSLSFGISDLFVLAILVEFSADAVSIQTDENFWREETMSDRFLIYTQVHDLMIQRGIGMK